MSTRTFVVAALTLALAHGGCGSDATTAGSSATPVEVLRPEPAPLALPPAARDEARPPAEVIADDAPLRAGRFSFGGMVRGTKGGLTVRGVVLGDDMLRRALASASAAPTDEALLGARVRMTAELIQHEDAPAREGGIVEQRRSGPWIQAKRVESAEITAQPVRIEGTISRSKGLFQVGEHLVTRDDLAWSLAPEGGKEGQRVRLWGQPRVYTCAPNEQCLSGGSIPMFDVGRAERVP